MNHDYLKKILTARVYDVAKETPLEPAERLSKRLNNTVLFKREDLQSVFSFKLRGAYNKLYQLSKQYALKQVVTASAGNHAQGVALAAQRMGIEAWVVMPEITPQIKIEAVKNLGGTVILHGANYDEAQVHAKSLCEQHNAPFIPPYDDPDVIAGQGTIGMELMRQCPQQVDAIFVPVGGGGLISGISAYIKSIRPDIKIIGVESVGAASMAAAVQAGRPVELESLDTFADGVAVKQVGNETFQVASALVDDWVQVSTDEICAAIRDIYEDTRSIAEPAGAVATAGAKQYLEARQLSGQCVVTMVCGANMNFDRLRFVAENAELGEQREMILGVNIPEKPGSFKQFCADIGKRNITEFNYRFTHAQQAHVFAGVELTQGKAEKEVLIQSLREKGYTLVDLSNNAMAKSHVRYMVGGQPDDVGRERIFRFSFPERPGALSDFLSTLGSQWNISLFHYRNHGSAYGRVLAGLQIEAKDDERLEQYLAELGYEHVEETDNEVYTLFLR